MRLKLIILTTALLAMNATSLASHADNPTELNILDHSDSNWATASNYAYSLASLGERYSRSYDYNLARSANNLHYAASDLYRALSYRSNRGRINLYDHAEDRVHQLLNQVGYLVDEFSQYAPYHAAQRARSLYYSMNNYVR